jgi:hypothetical protein
MRAHAGASERGVLLQGGGGACLVCNCRCLLGFAAMNSCA